MLDLFIPNNWFKHQFSKLDSRYPTMKVAINLFIQNGGSLILETGCQRQLEDWGAGCSTTVFGTVAQKYQKFLITVDNNEKHLGIAQEITLDLASFIKYELSNSVTYLNRFVDKIDLLYLDSWDYPLGFDYKTDEDYQRAIEDCQQHCLKEIKAAESNLHYNSVILIDDWDFPRGGKGKLAVDHLLNQKWQIVLDMQQVLLKR